MITNGALAQEPYKISNSEIQTYKDCKRKWWLGYYRRLKPKSQKLTGPLALGTRIHEALDVYYSTGQDLIEVHNELLAKDKILAQSLDMFTDGLDSEGELGRIMLEGFLEWSAEEGIDADLDIVSTEEILSAPLLNGRVELQGKLDMRVRRKSDGVRLFRDWKTVGTSFSEFAATAHMNEQIMTYMLLESLNTPEGEHSSGAIFTLLRKVKRTAKANPPFYQQLEVNHNVFTMRTFWVRLHGVLNDIMATKDALDAGVSHQQVAYRHFTKDCSWKCEFVNICPLFDDGSAVEEAIDDQFEVSDPYAYYADSDLKKGSE